MLYVSLVEIFVKSQIAFAAHGFSDADAYMYATISLFGGIVFYKGIDFLVHLIEGDVGDHNVDISLYDLDGSSSANSPRRIASAAAGGGGKKSSAPLPRKGGANDGGGGEHRAHSFRDFPHEHDVVVELSTGLTVRPSPDLHTLQLRMAGKVQQQPESPVSALTPECKVDIGDNLSGAEEGAGADGAVRASGAGEAVAPGDDQKLVRMGVMTAVAIGIHNFPEGLATFVAALSDPSVGLALAVAIAIHNIPEGLCVAIPVYYATGNRWKAFGWALLSGISEPIGAGLGWLILKDIMSELVYGLLFGVVAGMMVNITLHELIPTAVRYDPADKVTTNSIIAGMAIMALSLTLFLY
ncbi:unnamed protein product [Laminaria digitata]